MAPHGMTWALLLGLLCVTLSAAKDVVIITQPQPGQEFVAIHGGSTDSTQQTPPTSEFSTAHKIPQLKPRTTDQFSTAHTVPRPGVPLKVRDTRQVSLHDVTQVEVTDEGREGEVSAATLTADTEEKKIMARKIDGVSKKSDEDKREKELEKEKELPIKTKGGFRKDQQTDGSFTVKAAPVYEVVDDIAIPQNKYITVPKQITPSTIKQRTYEVISVNKPEEKQEKSDEGTFDFVDSPLGDKQLVSSGSSQNSRVNVKKGPNGQDYEYEYVYYYYDEDDELVGSAKPASSPTTTRVPNTTEPPRARRPVQDEEVVPTRPNGRNRYTTIERNRPTGGLEAVEATTPEPASNEVLPQTTRGGNRFRGRTVQATPEPVEQNLSEERLPANTRFPPRSRSNHNSVSIATQTPQTDTPITRIRGSVRRPSLELVDSSSFRTHSSDVSPDQDQNQALSDQEIPPRGQTRQRVRPATEDSLSIAVVPPSYNDAGRFTGTTHDSDLEEYIDSTVEERLPQQPKTTADITSTEHTTTSGFISAMTDKAAFDLYALLRETENEQSNLLYNEPTLSEELDTTEIEDETTQAPTTVVITTVPSTTTTTTTTSTTTTSTTTTTPEPPPSPAPGRGRYRGGVGPRNKFRNSATATTTTTEAPDEAATKRAKFSPSRNRETGQVSAYGRRGSKTTPSPDQSSSSSGNVEATPRSSGRSRYRGGSRNNGQTTSTTTEAPTSSSASSGFSRPTFGSDRYNLRRRGGARVTTSAPSIEVEAEDSEAGADDSASVSSTAKPTRPRLNIGGVRPLRPGPRINIGGRGRLGVPSTTATPAPVTEEPSTQQAEPSEQPEQEQTAETTTSAPADALTRLRNRPRLHVGAKAKPVPTPGSPTNRRALVSGLLPRRRPTGVTEPSTEATSTEEANVEEEVDNAETVPTIASTTEAVPPPDSNSRLSSLIGGRRRLPGRRPGLLPRPAVNEE